MQQSLSIRYRRDCLVMSAVCFAQSHPPIICRQEALYFLMLKPTQEISLHHRTHNRPATICGQEAVLVHQACTPLHKTSDQGTHLIPDASVITSAFEPGLPASSMRISLPSSAIELYCCLAATASSRRENTTSAVPRERPLQNWWSGRCVRQRKLASFWCVQSDVNLELACVSVVCANWYRCGYRQGRDQDCVSSQRLMIKTIGCGDRGRSSFQQHNLAIQHFMASLTWFFGGWIVNNRQFSDFNPRNMVENRQCSHLKNPVRDWHAK